MSRPSKTPGVCRIDQPSHRTHGFFARVHHRRKTYSAFFADKKYGGRKWALLAAQMYRSAVKRKLGIPQKTARRWWAEIVRRKGRSGILGVRRVVIGRRKFWQATWSPELGVARKKQFSLRKYGAERAKQLAIRARRAGLRSMK
jgi:hypothetical protein